MNECISDMVRYASVMIGNADVYEGDVDSRIWRYTTPRAAGGYCWALTDINHIEKAAVDCIDPIVKHKIPK